MIDDFEVYQCVSELLSDSVDREGAELSVESGEPESAISGLLDEAYTSDALSQEVIDYVQSIYTDGPVIEMLDALRMFENQ